DGLERIPGEGIVGIAGHIRLEQVAESPVAYHSERPPHEVHRPLLLRERGGIGPVAVDLADPDEEPVAEVDVFACLEKLCQRIRHCGALRCPEEFSGPACRPPGTSDYWITRPMARHPPDPDRLSQRSIRLCAPRRRNGHAPGRPN